ncbi:hypothetical protein Chor_017221, partial [Crotalus horridus]
AAVVWSSPFLLFLPGVPDWERGMEVPLDIALTYLIQGSFYAHSIYATLYMDAWRKDSVVMLIHHVVTLTLIVFSYIFRYHNIGILVLFLHDFSDIQLEFTKLNVYFKFWFRLYWFPLKVLYVTCHTSLQSVPNIPFYFFFNGLLFILTLMNVYWFLYIVVFVAKILLGQVQEVKDVREYDADAASKKTGKELHLHNSWKEG